MKKILILYMLVIMILMCACNSKSNKSDKSNEPSYRTITEEEDNSLIESDTPVSAEPNTEAAEIDELTITNDFSGFKGIVSDYVTPTSANLSINIKQGNVLSLVCSDSENDIIFYVNYGNDNYIYQLKDGIRTLLLEQEANFIQLWNGELYFIGVNPDSTDANSYYSNIYKYNLETKELTLVLDTITDWLFINSEGIFFTQKTPYDNNRFIVKICKIDFNGNLPETIDSYSLYFSQYKDYQLKYVYDDNVNNGYMALENINTKERIIKFNNINTSGDSNYLGAASIYGAHLYYIGLNYELYYINLDTGENKIFDIKKFKEEMDETWNFRLEGYTEHNGELFITEGSRRIYRVNLNSMNLIEAISTGNSHVRDNEQLYITGYEELFTCGDRLFAVRKVVNNSTKTLTQSITELIVTNDSITEKEMEE